MDKSVGPNGRIGYQAVANSKRHPLSVAEQAGLAKRGWQNGAGKTGLAKRSWQNGVGKTELAKRVRSGQTAVVGDAMSV